MCISLFPFFFLKHRIKQIDSMLPWVRFSNRSEKRSKCGLKTSVRLVCHFFVFTPFKSVSMRRPGRTRQGVIMLKSPISLKLGTNVRYQELTYVTECQVKILNSLGDPGSPCKNRHFARFMHN